MPLDAWRSTQSYPTNGLCARGFARELKLAVTGTVGDKPDYPLVERGFRDATGAELARATWHGWWHGQRLPNATYRTLVDNAFDGLARRWLFRSLKHDRLQAHFATLDLKWLAEHQPDDAQAQAWEIIRTLHQEWKPTPSGELRIASIVDDPPPGRGKTGGSRPSRPGFGRPKGVPARLSVRSTELGVSVHEPLNPSSVLVFLMKYAFESGLPDTGLKEAFILDFLTGVAAAACLVQIIAPERVDDWGLHGRLCMAMRSHFWPTAEEERVGLDALFVASIEPLLRLTATNCTDEAAMQLLRDLKTAYYGSLGATGLSERALREVASASVHAAKGSGRRGVSPARAVKGC